LNLKYNRTALELYNNNECELDQHSESSGYIVPFALGINKVFGHLGRVK